MAAQSGRTSTVLTSGLIDDVITDIKPAEKNLETFEIIKKQVRFRIHD